MPEDFEKEMDASLEESTGGVVATKHSEAPASVNMKCWIDGYGFLFTIRSGATKEQLLHMVERAKELVELAKSGGWKTDWNDTPAKVDIKPAPPLEGDIPSCPTHNIPMKLRNGKFGSFYACPTRFPDGTWCPQKVTLM